ncbi:uncharacterized protein K02A2.6-like [Armigeres subalbatus]|uniref:uncharacterized protein K02A2.6-like n=1 Tax=Armigeres subalbatus TaxID=124917 RepID=UPI002ED2910C
MNSAMEYEIRPLPPFRCEQIERSKLSREWKSWRNMLECYFEAHSIFDQRIKRAKLLFLGGPQLQRVFENLSDTDKIPLVALEKKWYDVAIERLNHFFQPVRQHTLERHRLREMKQMKDERFAQFVMRLKQQAADCGFDKYSPEVSSILTEITIIDVIVQGCLSTELRRRILKEDQTLAEIEALGAMFECVDEQLKSLDKTNIIQPQEKIFRVTENRNPGNKFEDNQLSCYRCGSKEHLSKSPNCPARNKTCRSCKRVGHFESVCRQSQKRPANNVSEGRVAKKIRAIESVSHEERMQPASVPVNTEKNDSQKTYYAFYTGNESNKIECRIGGIKCNVIIDSGSECNLITKEVWEEMKASNVMVQSSKRGCSRVLKAYGSDAPLKMIGSFTAEVRVQEQHVVAEFFVVDGGQQCLLGDETSKALGVLKVGLDINSVVEENMPFNKIAGIQVHIHMNSTIKPVFQPLRKVPVPLEAAVNKKLEQLLKRDIIEVKTGPTQWVSPLVVVGKANGEPRLCLDLRRVNEAVLRERYPMPIVDDYLAKMGRNMIRSKLDIKEAFLQVELDPVSRDITTFITSKGLFRFKRMPFGLATAPETFQRVMDEVLVGCEGAYWYLDDVMVEDVVHLDDEAKVRLLLRKLGPSEHERYTSYILPKSPNEITFDDTVNKLKSLFGTPGPESVISKPYRCLQVTKQVTEDYMRL